MELDPINRTEVFMAAAAGKDIELPRPITREEVFLSNIAGNVADINQNSVRDGEWKEAETITLDEAANAIEWTPTLPPDKVNGYRCYLEVPAAANYGGIVALKKTEDESYTNVGFATGIANTSKRYTLIDIVNNGGYAFVTTNVCGSSAASAIQTYSAKAMAIKFSEVDKIKVALSSASNKFPVDTVAKWYNLEKK